MKILAFHLFNDFSGSPRVLLASLRAIMAKHVAVELFTSDGGVLDSLDSAPMFSKHSIRYAFSSNPAVTVWRLLRSQAVAFAALLMRRRQSDEVVYVNTILPFGAALGARLTGRRLIYHYHENAFAKGRMYRALASLMQCLATEIICVSGYQASKLRRRSGVTVIPNAVPARLASALSYDPLAAFSRRRVLMLSSLKEYKGTHDFVRLAAMLPQYQFSLVINDTDENIDAWFASRGLSRTGCGNLTTVHAADDVARFYNEASVVVNLTNINLAVETFGLTAAEAMTAGLPVIVPVEGGIAELVTDGENGYRIDRAELPRIAAAIDRLLTDRDLYVRLAKGARAKSGDFAEDRFARAICGILMKQ